MGREGEGKNGRTVGCDFPVGPPTHWGGGLTVPAYPSTGPRTLAAGHSFLGSITTCLTIMTRHRAHNPLVGAYCVVNPICRKATYPQGRGKSTLVSKM